MHIHEFDVRPTDLDSFGHVNNARYLEYLEWARAEWSKTHGLEYAGFRKLGVIPAVVEARLRFQREVSLGDRLRVETRAEIAHSAKIVFKQDILNQHNQRVLRGEISVVAVDLETRSFTEFPPELVRAVKGEK